MKKVYQFDRRLRHRQALMLSSGFEIVLKLRQANHLSCHLEHVFGPRNFEIVRVLGFVQKEKIREK